MDGSYRIQGIAVTELADEYGTPLYVYDGAVLRSQFRTLRSALDPRLHLLYSLKANPNISVCALLARLGAGAEVSSLAELETAGRAGVPAGDTLFVGPGKSDDELRACVRRTLGAVVCESVPELTLLEAISRDLGKHVRAVLRINPAFSVKGSRLTMGGKPRQFGIDEGQLDGIRSSVAGLAWVRPIGVHCYLGTRILDAGDIVENTRHILDLARRVSTTLGFPLELVDIGGGLGVPYFAREEHLDVQALAAGLNPVITQFAGDHPGTRLLMETGRYLTAEAGMYIARVRYVKSSQNERFAILDGGTNHHLAAVGVGSFVKRNYPIRALTATDPTTVGPWNLAGPLCTPQDIIGQAVELPELRRGDLIGVERSGAYGLTASPGLFLGHGHPAEVLVDDGEAHLIRSRDGVDDLLRKQFLQSPQGLGVGAGVNGVQFRYEEMRKP